MWRGREVGLAFLVIVGLVLIGLESDADAHRSGCHRWHSCLSDTGSYVCGDLGYCSGCSDNQFCLAGQSRGQAADQPSSQPSSERKKSATTFHAGVPPQNTWACPATHPIKGNFTTYSGERCIYHAPGGAFYGKTRPERCYATDEEARQDGCRASKR
jgi:hypothetical protein